MRDLRVVRDHDAYATFPDELPCYLTCATFEYLNECALGFAAPVHANDFDRNPITMKNGTHFPRGQIDVVLTVIGYDKPETILVAADATRHKFEFLGQAIFVAPVFDDLARTDHARQPIDEQRTHALTFKGKSGQNHLYFQRFTCFC